MFLTIPGSTHVDPCASTEPELKAWVHHRDLGAGMGLY